MRRSSEPMTSRPSTMATRAGGTPPSSPRSASSPADARIYSNAAHGIYLTTDRAPVFGSPGATEARSYSRTNEVQLLREYLSRSTTPTYLALVRLGRDRLA